MKEFNCSIDGAQEKKMYRSSAGTKFIEKEPFNSTSFDCIAEVVYSRFAEACGIPCCKVELLEDGKCRSYFDKSAKHKKDADDVFPKNIQSTDDILLYVSHKFGDIIRKKVLSMFIMDLFMRQQDRHLKNYGFIVDEFNKVTDLYPLFDNGLCLFAVTDFSKSHGFRCYTGLSNDVLDDCSKYDCSRLFQHIPTKQELLQLWDNIPDTLSDTTTKSALVDWVLDQVEYILDTMNKAITIIRLEDIIQVEYPIVLEEKIDTGTMIPELSSTMSKGIYYELNNKYYYCTVNKPSDLSVYKMLLNAYGDTPFIRSILDSNL